MPARISVGIRMVSLPRFSFCFGGLPLATLSLSPETEASVKLFVHTIRLICAQNCRWYEYMNAAPIQESRGPDRYFVACIDGRQTVFVLHADHSVCIAPTTQPVTVVEPTETVLGELVGLAASN